MRIHLVRNSTSARFEKNLKIFTLCKFIQLVRPIIHLVLIFALSEYILWIFLSNLALVEFRTKWIRIMQGPGV